MCEKINDNPVPSMNNFIKLLKKESSAYFKRTIGEGKMNWNDTQIVTRFLSEFINKHYSNGVETDKERPKDEDYHCISCGNIGCHICL